MAKLHQFQAKKCFTAAGCLVHEGKVLMIKHKKLGLWLNPGGHIEDDELPHQAAEREFWEETGVKVKAIEYGVLKNEDKTEFLPTPISTNLHWISQENYAHRTTGEQRSEKTARDWGKGCEQHVNFLYLVEPVDGVEFSQNIEETDGIAWFTEEEVKASTKIVDPLKSEVLHAFAVISSRK